MSVSTAALIQSGDSFLFVRRPPGGALSECWELPGGKVDAGETPPQALQRELEEELGIESVIGDLAGTSRFTHRGNVYDLHAYFVSANLEPMVLKEHTDLHWCTLQSALSLDLAASDRSLIELLLAAAQMPGRSETSIG